MTTLASFITAGAGVRGLQARQSRRLRRRSARPTSSRRWASPSSSVPRAWRAASQRPAWGSASRQRFHPAMRFVGPVRKELGVPHRVQLPRPAHQPGAGPAPARRGERPGDGPQSWPASSGPRAAGARSSSTPTTGSTSSASPRPRASWRCAGDGDGGVRGDAIGGWTRPRSGCAPPPWRTCVAATPRFNAQVIRDRARGRAGGTARHRPAQRRRRADRGGPGGRPRRWARRSPPTRSTAGGPSACSTRSCATSQAALSRQQD